MVDQVEEVAQMADQVVEVAQMTDQTEEVALEVKIAFFFLPRFLWDYFRQQEWQEL